MSMENWAVVPSTMMGLLNIKTSFSRCFENGIRHEIRRKGFRVVRPPVQMIGRWKLGGRGILGVETPPPPEES